MTWPWKRKTSCSCCTSMPQSVAGLLVGAWKRGRCVKTWLCRVYNKHNGLFPARRSEVHMKPGLDGGFTQLLSAALGKIGSGFGYVSIVCRHENNLDLHMAIIDEGATEHMARHL